MFFGSAVYAGKNVLPSGTRVSERWRSARLWETWGRSSSCFIRETEKRLSRAMFDRVTFDPKLMGGRACIRRIRISVSVIVNQVAHGASFEDIPARYPDLERQDIQQAIEYAAWLAQERVENT